MRAQRGEVRLPIKGHMLRWARERARLTHEQLAQRLSVRQATIRAWEEGSAFPTWRQAWKLAGALHVPIGYFFLERPPLTLLPIIVDFRTPNTSQRPHFSPELEDTLNDALRKRDWLREWRAKQGFARLSFVGRYRPKADPKQVAQDIRERLNLPLPTASGLPKADPEQVAQDIREKLNLPLPTASGLNDLKRHLSRLVQHAEQAGILVLQSGVAQGNAHRPLSVDEFRGFALADPYAPVIFINARDSVAGRIFTFAHELAHLWIGTTGVSNPAAVFEAQQQEGLQVEVFCNRVAAEVLMPRELFVERWRRSAVQDGDVLKQVEAQARYFLVSNLAALVRARALRLIDEACFLEVWHDLQQQHNQVHAQKAEGSGGSFRANLHARNGRPLVEAVVQAVSSGRLLITEAAQLLNVSPATLSQHVLRAHSQSDAREVLH